MGAEPPSLRSPVTIEWEPVQGARRYEIHLVGVHPSLECRQTVTSPRWQADLPASEPGSFYLLGVTARTERAPIAWTMLHFAVQQPGALGEAASGRRGRHLDPGGSGLVSSAP